MLISIDVKFPSSSHFSRQFHGIQGCLDLQILSKQQMSFFELYFCCICCFYAVVVLFLLRETCDFSAILSCSTKTTQPSQLLSIFLASCYTLTSFCKHPGSVRGTQSQFLENSCSEDDMRSRIFRTFFVKFVACLPLLGRLNI